MIQKKHRLSRNMYINEHGIIIIRLNNGAKSTKQFIKLMNSGKFEYREKFIWAVHK